MLPLGVDGYEVFQRSFDFSKFQNLQEVEFGVGWMSGGLPWIPIALSTLRPVTSPYLSIVKLDFSSSPVASVGALVEGMPHDDPLLVADETARIGRKIRGSGECDRSSGSSVSGRVQYTRCKVPFLWSTLYFTPLLISPFIPCRFFNIEPGDIGSVNTPLSVQ